jgi:hypothetical protein
VVDLACGICGDLGGEPYVGFDDAYEPDVALDVTLGKESLYQPPENVNAIN